MRVCNITISSTRPSLDSYEKTINMAMPHTKDGTPRTEQQHAQVVIAKMHHTRRHNYHSLGVFGPTLSTADREVATFKAN